MDMQPLDCVVKHSRVGGHATSWSRGEAQSRGCEAQSRGCGGCRRRRGVERGRAGAPAAARCAGPGQPVPHVRRLGCLAVTWHNLEPLYLAAGSLHAQSLFCFFKKQSKCYLQTNASFTVLCILKESGIPELSPIVLSSFLRCYHRFCFL